MIIFYKSLQSTSIIFFKHFFLGLLEVFLVLFEETFHLFEERFSHSVNFDVENFFKLVLIEFPEDLRSDLVLLQLWNVIREVMLLKKLLDIF